MAADAAPKRSTNSSDLYTAVEALKEKAVNAFVEFENEGDLAQLISDLGAIRDRADSIQTAAMQVSAAFSDYL